MSNAPIPRKTFRAKVQEYRTQLGLAVRVTIAAVLAFTLSRPVFVPLPLWTVLTAVILTQVTFGRSVKATLELSRGHGRQRDLRRRCVVGRRCIVADFPR
jgi:uncharacterized membrane protein YccC